MPERDATPPMGSPEPFFLDTAHVELDDRFFPLPGANWFWLPFTNSGSGPRSESRIREKVYTGKLMSFNANQKSDDDNHPPFS